MSYDNPNLAIVKAITEQHLTVSEASVRFKRSRQWIYTLLRRYEEGGPEAVKPRSTAPKTHPTKVSEEVIKQIIKIRRELASKGADNGPETIAWVLEQRGFHAPAESTIRRILTKNGMVTPQPKKRPKAYLRRFEATMPNECWQADVTSTRLLNGQVVEILDFLDDHSRFLLYLGAYKRVAGPTVVTAAETITKKYGFPQSTLTDNGLVFTARLAGAKGGKNGFEKFLEKHSILQKNGRAGHPQTQGKIERFHQTLKKMAPRTTTRKNRQRHAKTPRRIPPLVQPRTTPQGTRTTNTPPGIHNTTQSQPTTTGHRRQPRQTRQSRQSRKNHPPIRRPHALPRHRTRTRSNPHTHRHPRHPRRNLQRRNRRNHRRTPHRHRPPLPTQPNQEHPTTKKQKKQVTPQSEKLFSPHGVTCQPCRD